MKLYLLGIVVCGCLIYQGANTSTNVNQGSGDNRSALEKAADLIKSHEGFRAQAYIDPVGVPTIGWGTTRINGNPVQLNQSVSEQEAKSFLVEDLNESWSIIEQYVEPDVLVKMNDEQKASLVSFIYNLGPQAFINPDSGSPTSFNKTLNSGDIDAAANEMLRYVNGGGRTLPGLVTRRKQEAEILRNGIK